jgi:hypothetical protein
MPCPYECPAAGKRVALLHDVTATEGKRVERE